MPVPWIQVYSNLPNHPKTYALADALKLPGGVVSSNYIASGMLIGLWTWAIINAVDGDISKCTPRALADAAGWRKKPEAFLSALSETGWIDKTDAGYVLHDWEEYAGLLIAQEDKRKQGTRERVTRYRARKMEEHNEEQDACKGVTDEQNEEGCNVTKAPCNALRNGYGNVTVTPCNAPTIPCTIPNHNNTHSGDAHAREAIAFYERISGGLASAAMQEEIQKRVAADSDLELIKEALRLCAGKQRPAPYFSKLLQNWSADGIKDYRDYCQRNKSSPVRDSPRREKTFAELAAEMEDGS